MTCNATYPVNVKSESLLSWARGLFRVVILLLFPPLLSAQADTTRLTMEEFIGIVIRHHPVARQANLQWRVAEVERLAGRSGFDPELSGAWNDKYYAGTHYYRHAEGKLRLPTWLGVDLTAAYQQGTGTYVNPEALTDEAGLWAVGVEANLLQGLITDERRTARKQAEVFSGLALAERTRMINDILLEAMSAYADWLAAEQAIAVVRENLLRAEDYFNATRESWRQGANPAIDTLEAFLIVQDQLTAIRAFDRNLVKARQTVESFLWLEGVPAELQPGIGPEEVDPDRIPAPEAANIAALVESNPEVMSAQLSLSQYALEQRLKQQKLLPKLRVKYYPLLTPQADAFLPAFDIANYRWGIDFAMPLTFRQARADAEQATLKLEMAEFKLQDKRNVLLNKAEALWQESSLLAAQVEIENSRVNNYRSLLEAEQERFAIGESSVFLLNKRQESYFDARIKFIDLKAKYLKTIFSLMQQTNTLVGFAESLAPGE